MASKKTRNICILAHVDHGKTTLADHLIAGAGGGVVHPKLAGKLRYLDYRDDEQQRAITMKSASIALNFRDHVVNLIDSPGHVDFCSEVSTAVRLSDGGLVLVDVCEGVHIQTHAVLRQAFLEQVKPCLVLNKMDRFITELRLTPLEAYIRIQGIITEVNNIMSSLRSEKYLSDVDAFLARSDRDRESNNESEEEEEEEFAPQNGNVAFSSALDGWAFRIDNFVDLGAEKLGITASELRSKLWGDFFYSRKLNKIVGKKEATGSLKPSFVELILEPLWQVYNSCLNDGGGGGDLLEKVIRKMNLSVPPRELRNKESRVALQAVMCRWLPLSDNILTMVVEVLPDPISAQGYRTSHMLPQLKTTPTDHPEIESVRKAIETCNDSPQSPCVAFVSKMFAVPVEMLPRKPGEVLELDDGELDHSCKECFLGFARVFSGVLSVGQDVCVLSALYDPTDEEKQSSFQVVSVKALYLMMGRGLDPVESVSAGNIVAIRGLGQAVLKSATISSTPNCFPIASLNFQAAPIVRVAVEPSDPANLSALSKGLKLLNRADPFVQVTISNTGEHVISAAGEVHLELCIKDLRERFARVELVVSSPLVAFKETIDDESSDEQRAVRVATPNGRAIVRAQVTKLPTPLIQVLEESSDLIKSLLSEKKVASEEVEALKNRLNSAAAAEKFDCKILQRIWSCNGPNLLVLGLSTTTTAAAAAAETGAETSTVEVQGDAYVSELLGFEVERRVSTENNTELVSEAKSAENNIVSGFQLATSAGPLCKEPLWGTVFTVEVSITATSSSSSSSSSRLETAGQLIAAVKEACHGAVLKSNPRLVEAMYLCEVSTSSSYMGQMYGVLARRRARMVKGEMREGMDMFTAHAFMPVAESFGFAEELRRKTSGAASPQLMLSHWEVLREDPFFVPKTEEELEEFGDGASVPKNTARKLIDAVRRRKGLPVEEKIVRHATKQRTRAKKV